MREILFKAKRLDNGEWVEGYYIGPVGALNVHEICDIHDITGTRVEVEPSTRCEYTGLTDKNGKKIFEGDIVEGIDFSEEDGYGVVQWDDGAFEVVGGGLCGTFYENYWGKDFEVIGSIHDGEGGQHEGNE